MTEPVTGRFIDTGERVLVQPSPITLLPSLPARVYYVRYDESTHQLYLMPGAGVSRPEGRVYGHANERVDKITDRWRRTDRALGVMSIGPRGMGKTLIKTIVANRFLYDEHLPVYIIDQNLPGLVDFVRTLPAGLVDLDEFDKVFLMDGHRDDQSQWLSLLDGSARTPHHLVYIAANDALAVSPYLRNRPGRVRLWFTYDYLTKAEVGEYLSSEAPWLSQAAREEIQDFALRVPVNYDHLAAIVDEMDAGEGSEPRERVFSDVITDLNIKAETETFTLSLSTSAGTYVGTVGIDPVSTDDITALPTLVASTKHGDAADNLEVIFPTDAIITTRSGLGLDLEHVTVKPYYEYDKDKLPTAYHAKLVSRRGSRISF